MTAACFQPMPPALLAEVKSNIARIRQQTPAVARMPGNSLGRDFVVGDIHGAFNLVRQAMRAVHFDQKLDRLFCCGDLIDRGSESHVASRFLAANFVRSIMGNHEADLLDVYAELAQEGDGNDELPIQALAKIDFNGMRWLQETSPQDRAAVLEAIAALPLAIEVETPRGLAAIIHGEVPIGMDWPTFRQGLIERDEKITESCLYGRTRIQMGSHEPIRGIDRVYCGHTPQFEGAVRLGQVMFLDTGGVFSQMEKTRANHPMASLTMAGMCFSTGLLTAAPRFAQVREPTSGEMVQTTAIRLLYCHDVVTPFNSSWVDHSDAEADNTGPSP